jgi:hypothetical protein
MLSESLSRIAFVLTVEVNMKAATTAIRIAEMTTMILVWIEFSFIVVCYLLLSGTCRGSCIRDSSAAAGILFVAGNK